MCNAYKLEGDLTALIDAFSETRIPIRLPGGRPNIKAQSDIRITDRAPILRVDADGPRLDVMRWSWPGPSGKPVFNFRSEGRRFPRGRCLIPADGFYEYTGSKSPKTKWLFSLRGHAFFAIAGLVREGDAGGEDAWTMLTCAPGPDVAPYHDRQVVVLRPDQWASWLSHEPNEDRLLQPLAVGSLLAERALP